MDTMLLKIKDIPGTAETAGYERQIEVLSYSHGVAMQLTGDVSDKERTSGKPHMQDFQITKYLDNATPLLNQKCCEGTNLGEVQLTVGRNDGGNVIPFIVYTLSDVLISSVTVGGGGGDKPVESLSLNFSAIKWDYRAQHESGGYERVAGGWDVAANARK